jgi:hypothetical protein
MPSLVATVAKEGLFTRYFRELFLCGEIEFGDNPFIVASVSTSSVGDHRMHLHKALLALVPAMAVLSACGPQIVPSTGPHPALSPDAVKLYQNSPAKYEDLGKIVFPITPDVRWDERGDAKPAFARLKAQAAAMGANGILLKGDTGPNGRLVGAGDGTTYYLVPVQNDPRAAIVEAIYVIKE